jgi:archaellum component FlaC
MKKNINKFQNIEISPLYDKIAFIGSIPLPVTDIAKGLNKFEDNISSFSKSIENIQKEIQKSYVAFQETAKEIPEDLKKIQKYLAEKSWYISLDLPVDLSRKIADLIVEEKDGKIEKAMQNYARLRVASVKEKVIKLYPQRKRILEDAFLAH